MSKCIYFSAMVRRMFVLGILIFPHFCAYPQESKQRQKSPEGTKGQLTYKVPVDIVVVNVTVTDGKGNPVTDLTAGDFKVYDDGKPQPIQTFTMESHLGLGLQDAGENNAGLHGAAATTPNYTRPRLIALAVDDITSPADDHYVAMLDAARRFIEKDMGPGDQISLLAGSGHTQYPFSGDKALLLEEVRSFAAKLSVARASRSTCPLLTDLQARRIASNVTGGANREGYDLAIQQTLDCLGLRDVPDGERIAETHVRSMAMMQWSETEYRNRILVQTLKQYIRSLRHFQATKSLILFSNGFVFQELSYDLQNLVDEALRSGIVMNTIDSRGLYTDAPQGGDRASLPAHLSRIRQALSSEDLTSRDSALNLLAHDTGGTYYRNSNNLYAGLRQISDRHASYYVLTYASPSPKPDGRYHRIKLQVARSGLELSYRDGYYSQKEELTFERRRKEDILEALRAPGDVNDVPVYFSYNYYQLDDSQYRISFIIHADVQRILFPEEDSRRRNQLSLVVVVLDEAGNYVDGLVKTVEFNLTPAGYSELLNRGLVSRADFQLAPGSYKIKAVVREGVQSKVGSINRTVSIP